MRRSKPCPPIPARELDDFLDGISVSHYLRGRGFPPYHWQVPILDSAHTRKIINGARQAGKSTVVAGKPCHHAKYYPGSLWIVGAATEKQAVEDMEKIKDFIARDRNYPAITRDSDTLLEFANRSRILVIPATEKAARGFSNPDGITLDEDARIEDPVYRSGIRPMLTDNEKCELILISTPNGREGHFFRAWQSYRWERYAIRAPWNVNDETWQLVETQPEGEFALECAKLGILGFYSPRHKNLPEQQENLEEMGPLMYRQEYLCEFVEPEDQVFKYEHIDRAFSSELKPMDLGLVKLADIPPLEVEK